MARILSALAAVFLAVSFVSYSDAQAVKPAMAMASKTDVVAALKAAGATKYLSLVEAAGATKALAANAGMAGVVIIAPTDAAIAEWSKGMAMQSVMDQKAQAQRIVGYTIALPASMAPMATSSQFVAGKPVVLPTANLGWNVTVTKSADGKFTATDAHGATAPLKPVAGVPSVFLTDKVLLPGNVFPSMSSMTYMMHGNMMQPFTVFQAALERSGLHTALKSAGPTTFFAPTDAAFAAAGVTRASVAAMEPAKLKDLLSYHAIAGYHSIPKGITSGKPVPTLLKGGSLTVTLKESKAQGYMVGEATVTDAAGNVAKVVAPNMFAGTDTVHAIDKVLSPKPAAGKMAMAGSMAMGGGMAMGGDMAMAKPGGRKMLQFGGGIGTDNAASFASNNARDAILSAVNSDGATSVYAATQIAQQNAAYTVYPTTQQYFTIGSSGGFNGRH